MRPNRYRTRTHESTALIALGVMGWLLGSALITFLLWGLFMIQLAGVR